MTNFISTRIEESGKKVIVTEMEIFTAGLSISKHLQK